MSKTIITAAITGGIHVPSMSPYLPITPGQIVNEAVRANQAGAAIVHIHARNPQDGSPTSDENVYREIVSGIASRCDAIICLTTGGSLGMPIEQRLKMIPILEPELASCNAGSLNFGIFPIAERIKEFKYDWEKAYLENTEDFIFPNTFKTLVNYSNIFIKADVKPEFEVYDSAMINNIGYLIKKGCVKKPVHIQFVLGILGGLAAEVRNLVFLKETAERVIGEFTWSIATAGKYQLPMCAAALAMGGHIRVGLEDSLYIGRNVPAKSNAEQVEKAVELNNILGLEVADPEEARSILGLKGKEKTKYLANE